MRALLISDIHANIYGLRAIAEKETWDTLYCCGDLMDYGPFPLEVIGWMRDQNATVVWSNHDTYLLTQSKEACDSARREGVWKWVHDNYSKLDQEALAYLAALPQTVCFTMDGIAYQMQHQYDKAYGPIESMDQFDAFWQGEQPSGQERRLLFGHSHRRCVHRLDQNALWLNPGSASYRRPDDPDKRAHYMIIDNGEIFFGAVAYDRTPLLNAAKDALRRGGMLETELQDAFFFFGDAPTSRSPLPAPSDV